MPTRPADDEVIADAPRGTDADTSEAGPAAGADEATSAPLQPPAERQPPAEAEAGRGTGRWPGLRARLLGAWQKRRETKRAV